MALVYGTIFADIINAADGVTNYSDEISGLGGDDVIYGLGGDDVLRGGLGFDYLDGGDGYDWV